MTASLNLQFLSVILGELPEQETDYYFLYTPASIPGTL